MSKEIRKGFGFALGAATVAALGYGVYRFMQECETSEVSEKTKEWFSEKKKYYATLINDRKDKIEDISDKLKKDVVKEIDEIKRKKLVEEATKKITKLRSEIAELTNQKKEEFKSYIKTTNLKEMAGNAISSARTLAGKAKDNIDKYLDPKLDVDFDLEIIEDE